MSKRTTTSLQRFMAEDRSRNNPKARKLAAAQKYLQSVDPAVLAGVMRSLSKGERIPKNGFVPRKGGGKVGCEYVCPIDGIRNAVELAKAVRHEIAGRALAKRPLGRSVERRKRELWWVDYHVLLQKELHQKDVRRAQNLRRAAKLPPERKAMEQAKKNLWKAMDRLKKMQQEIGALEAGTPSGPATLANISRLEAARAALPGIKATAAKWTAEVTKLSG